MIPTFPEFKPLELSDRDEVRQLTGQYPPYSDFNFISMWSWDIKGEMRLSMLYGNLVVRFNDYLTGQPFYSFIGTTNVNETATTLLEYCKAHDIQAKLCLVPEVSASLLDTNTFSIEEERDHFDYIYEVEKVKTYEGGTHKSHRKSVRYFEQNHTYEQKILDITQEENQERLIALVQLWIKNKSEKNLAANELDDFFNEYLALKRIFSAPKELLDSVICFSVFVDGELSGFMIDERVADKYCISHFGKTNIAHKGAMQFLMKTSTNNFFDLGVHYYNDEQDLGLPSLRRTKSSYHLAHFLRKYSVSFKNG